MTHLTNSPAGARRALWLSLIGMIAAWVLVLVTVFSDILVDNGRSSTELWDPETAVAVRPSTYLYFAAIAVFTLGSLFAKRRAAQLQAAGPDVPFTRSVQVYSSTIIIIGLVLSAFAAVTVFLSNLFDSGTEDAFFERVLNSYLPIVLYAALALTVILAGFVLARPSRATGSRSAHAEPAQEASEPTGANAATESPAEISTETVPGPELSATARGGAESQAQRATGFAYALPIIAVAVALIFGLIVYDATRTPLEAWIWVIVQLIVGAGIVWGTYSAARAYQAWRGIGARPSGTVVGARVLNLVLSIIFAAIVAIMSLSYGVSAVSQLRVEASLSVSAYLEQTAELDAENGVEGPIEDLTVSLNGYGLDPGTDAEIRLAPDTEVLASERVDRSGWVWVETPLQGTIQPGNYQITASGHTADGREMSASLEATVTETGTVQLPAGTDAESSDDTIRVATPTASWLFGDLAPAVVLMCIVVLVLRLTLGIRAREGEQPQPPREPQASSL